MDHPRRIVDPRAVAAALRADRDVLNSEFDALLPNEHRTQSACYWTPVRVAVAAGRWLEANGANRVLDVGSGVGKFCSIGAAVGDLTFDGLERRPHLVAVADDLARRLGVAERTEFRVGDLSTARFRDYDALYFYNPFAEGYYGCGTWLDNSVELSPGRAKADIEEMEDVLASLEVGVQVITYHGFGGRFPDSYRLLQSAAFGGGRLLCWQKRRAVGTGRYLAEDDWA